MQCSKFSFELSKESLVRFGNAMKNEQFGLCLMLKNGEGRSGRQDDKSLEFSTWVSAAHQRLTSHLRHTHTPFYTWGNYSNLSFVLC